MRQGLTAVLVAGLVGSCVPAPPPLPERDGEADLDQLAELDLPEVAATSVLRRAQQITVRIRSLGCDRLGLGSGFVLPGDLVVTNRHVVEEPREVTVNTWDGRSLRAEVSGIAVDSDLAILQLADVSDLPVAELRDEPVVPGEKVIAVGYPGGGPATISTGEVVSLIEGELLDEPADVIRVDAEIRQGNSGGPLLDEEGHVIGVVFALDVTSGDGLVVPIDTLLERLDGRDLATPTADC
ncbi:S1C family serine protease [Nitriliruptor alkaliphilus]|uniref:S1C family serine protease n=1 Tax=Nitriliruptor alkaliphilus TaxID=427918 RepID=UPI001FE14810|nr:trypsin-like peptidase domain-containing protein [Nitriliruptor alkaliphilus]